MVDKNETELNNFIKKVEEKFKKYFVAYGVRKHIGNYSINIIIDDRDIMKMEKRHLQIAINSIFKLFLKKNQDTIKARVIFVSDLNETNIWKFLGKRAVILNVKATSSFVNIKLPSTFLKVYEKLPKKFKLSDFIREISKISKKTYHRNTYQNWLKSLKTARFLKLKDKTYSKMEEPYKQDLLNSLKISKF